MDWERVSETISFLDTLAGDDLSRAITDLEKVEPQLAKEVRDLRSNGAQAASFMQTRMCDAPDTTKRSLVDDTIVGVWRVKELLGAGGMGEVYRAVRADGLFEQVAALKIAKTKTKAFRERFETERQRLAQLEHANIARIIDGGTSDTGAPYMTMEFVEGQPINTYAKENGLGRPQRLSLMRRLCSALSHAHGRLVLHRDIKHDNVLVNVDGEVRLIDFGVASLLDDSADIEVRGPLTIGYAAPEQLEGTQVSVATDVFAIGMLAHLLETGKLPKRQGDGGVVIDEEGIGDADLSAVLAKATAKDAQDRYTSVNSLDGDLRRLIEGFVVSARPVSSFTKFKKLVARNKIASIMSGAAMTAIVAGVVVASMFAVQANEARAEAEARLKWAEFSLEESELSADRSSAQYDLLQKFTIENDRISESELRSFLISSANSAKDGYFENPDRSAAIMYSVVEYLMRRGDYNPAIEIANYIIENDRTSEINTQAVKLDLGRMRRELGDNEEAIRLYKEVLVWMRQRPFLADSQQYAVTATHYSLLTLVAADFEEASRANLIHALDESEDANTRAYFFNSLNVLQGRLGNFDQAIEYGKKAVEFSKQAEAVNFVSVNTRSLNLAESILRMKRDVDLARQYLPPKSDVMDPEKGHLRHRSMYFEIEAVIAQIKGDHAQAFAHAEQAIAIVENDYPPESPYRLALSGLAVETAAMSGSLDRAEEYLPLTMVPASGGNGKPHVRGYMAEVFVLNAQGQREEALAAYEALDHARIDAEYKLIYKRDLLRSALGLSPLE